MTKSKKAAPALDCRSTVRVWHKGPPPHVGWWNASAIRDLDLWRWWDGERWSWAVLSNAKPEEVAHQVALTVKPEHAWRVLWTDYWPENARVPRLNPADGWLLNTGALIPDGLKACDQVEFVLRKGGGTHKGSAGTLLWVLYGMPGDIFAWRRAR